MAFQPFHPHGEVIAYRLHLPHWRQPGVTYFVTTRLADSLPAGKLKALEIERHQWLIARGCHSPDDLPKLADQDRKE